MLSPADSPFLFTFINSSWETQVQLVGPGKSLNGREKNSGEEGEEEPLGQVLTDQFQTVGVVLVSDWCQKTLVFFCPITEQQD